MQKKTKKTGRFVKTGEAARMLGLSPHSIREAVRRGDLPGMRVGHLFVIDRQGLEELLCKRARESTPAA